MAPLSASSAGGCLVASDFIVSLICDFAGDAMEGAEAVPLNERRRRGRPRKGYALVKLKVQGALIEEVAEAPRVELSLERDPPLVLPEVCGSDRALTSRGCR